MAGGLGSGLATASSLSEESIQQYQVDATLEGDTLSVVETIDYDFSLNSRRGIFRELDLGVVDQIDTVELQNAAAATETANDDLEVTSRYNTEVRRRWWRRRELVTG